MLEAFAWRSTCSLFTEYSLGSNSKYFDQSNLPERSRSSTQLRTRWFRLIASGESSLSGFYCPLLRSRAFICQIFGRWIWRNSALTLDGCSAPQLISNSRLRCANPFLSRQRRTKKFRVLAHSVGGQSKFRSCWSYT